MKASFSAALALLFLAPAARAEEEPSFAGRYRGQGVELELSPAGDYRYEGTLSFGGPPVRCKLGGVSRVSGLCGEEIVTLSVDGDRAELKRSGRTWALRRGAQREAPGSSAAPPSSAAATSDAGLETVVAPGPPPLKWGVVVAWVAYNEFLLKLLLANDEVSFSREQRETLATQFVASWAQTPPAARQKMVRLPSMVTQLVQTYGQLPREERRKIATWYQQQWQAQSEQAARSLPPAQRAQVQAWNQTAAALQRGQTTRAQQLYAERMAREAQFQRSLRAAMARKRERGPGTVKEQMAANMTYHFVQTNMANMTTNMFLTGSPLPIMP